MWKKVIINEQETNYSVSDKGEIKNDITGRKLKPSIQQGYCHVGLTINGKVKRCRVHRLVTNAFLPNPDKKPYVNHIDGCRSNNNINNLEWCTPSYNTQHAVKLGLIKSKKVYQYDLNDNLICVYKNVNEVAKVFNTSKNMIYLVCNGYRKTYKKYKFSY